MLRLWVASSDYRDDVRLSKDILKELSEGYRKIRNTLRYALSNLFDFDPAKDAVARRSSSLPLDQWALAKLNGLTAQVKKAYEDYEFHLVYHSVVEFCAIGAVGAVLRHPEGHALQLATTGDPKRRSAQTVLYRIAHDLLLALAPVTSFTAEEAWRLPARARGRVGAAGRLSQAATGRSNDEVVQRYDRLFAVRAQVMPLLEAARRDKLIGKAEDAKVVLQLSGPWEFAQAHVGALADLLKVSQLVLGAPAKGVPAGEGVVAEVLHADGQKCPRCWLWRLEVEAQGLCDRCKQVTSAT